MEIIEKNLECLSNEHMNIKCKYVGNYVWTSITNVDLNDIIVWELSRTGSIERLTKIDLDSINRYQSINSMRKSTSCIQDSMVAVKNQKTIQNQHEKHGCLQVFPQTSESWKLLNKLLKTVTPESRLFGTPIRIPTLRHHRCTFSTMRPLTIKSQLGAWDLSRTCAVFPWMASFAARITRYHQPYPWMHAQNPPQMVAKPVIIHIQAASSTYAASTDMQLVLKTGTDQARFKWYRIPCINHNNL